MDCLGLSLDSEGVGDVGAREAGDDGGSFNCSGLSRCDQEGGGGHVGITKGLVGGSFG